MRRVSCFLGVLFLLLLANSAAGQTAADIPSQAGLVVHFGEGQVEALCIGFEETQITGVDLLTRSGLELTVDASGGMGLTVCQIEGVGCAHPAEPCFCQCMGGEPCVYWNYYFRDPGDSDWTYSALGAALRKVQPGAVEAWVWGDGKTPPSSDLTFGAICSPATVTPTVAPPSPTVTATSATATAPTVATPATASAMVETPAAAVTAATATATESPNVVPAVTPTNTVLASKPKPTPVSEPEQNLAAYWPFGVMILGLAVVGVLVWVRRA